MFKEEVKIWDETLQESQIQIVPKFVLFLSAFFRSEAQKTKQFERAWPIILHTY